MRDGDTDWLVAHPLNALYSAVPMLAKLSERRVARRASSQSHCRTKMQCGYASNCLDLRCGL